MTTLLCNCSIFDSWKKRYLISPSVMNSTPFLWNCICRWNNRSIWMLNEFNPIQQTFFFAVPKSFYFWLHLKHRPRAIIDAQYTHQCNVQIEIMLEANSIGTWISFFHYTKIEILCSTFRLKYKVQVVIKKTN